MKSNNEKTAVVTGANSGLGFEAAAQLAAAGWGRIILACRTEEKAAAAAESLAKRTGRKVFQTLAIDTAEVASAHCAAEALNASVAKVDFLLLNAGASSAVPQYNADGFEITWASTLAGHHVLTVRLLELGLLSEHARIVIAGSEGARSNLPGMKVHPIRELADKNHAGDRAAAIVALARIAGPSKFNSMNEYVTAKLVVSWWAAALSRRLPPGMTVNSVSPGSAPGSKFVRNAPWTMRLLMVPMMKVMGPFIGMAGSLEQGAARYIEAEGLSDRETGHFYATAHRKKLVGKVGVQSWPGYFKDRESQEAGFQAVEQMTRVAFPRSSVGTR